MICPPFFRPHKNDLGLTRFTKPLLDQMEAARDTENYPDNVIILPWERK